jgi:peptidoglycan/LPS O-acetylase OafA/YrhL
LASFLIFQGNIHHAIWNSIFEVPVISKILIEFLFLYLIIGVSIIDQSIIKLRNKFISFLGEISYGIYMYHMLVIFTIMQFMKKILMDLSPIMSVTLFYIILIPSVILVSSVSKIVFENYFLNLKVKIDKSNISPHIGLVKND